MRKTILVTLLLLFIVPALSTFGQRWKRTRYELIGGIGLSSLMGDLGGSNSDAIYMVDYDFLASRFAIDLGMRYKIQERIAVKLNLIPAMLYASDALTKSDRRGDRGLQAKTFIFETSVQGEYSIIKEKLSTRYTFRNMRDFRLRNVNTYLFLGFGGFYFKPNATSTGSRPVDNSGGYKITIPAGIGFKYGINRRVSLNVEYGYRKTFSDTVDGITTPYSKANDVYMFLMVKVARKLRTSRNGWPTF